MTRRTTALRAAALACAALLATACGSGSGGGGAGAGTTAGGGATTPTGGPTTFRDPSGDVTGGPGPDIVSVTVSSTPRAVAFGVRFAEAPPLATDAAAGWTDMLLLGIDVPPYGPAPQPPTDWLGLDYVAGLHGAQDSVRFRRMRTDAGADTAAPSPPVYLPATRDGATIRFAIPRRLLGDPSAIRFQAAAGREGADEGGGGGDFAPDTGTYEYALTG